MHNKSLTCVKPTTCVPMYGNACSEVILSSPQLCCSGLDLAKEGEENMIQLKAELKNGRFVCTTVKVISLEEKGIDKLVFLYDNGKTYTAARVKNVKFTSKDVDGNFCIDYSTKSGVYRVYRDDLAAITVHYSNDVIATQKLMDKVVARQEVRMQKRPVKQTKEN